MISNAPWYVAGNGGRREIQSGADTIARTVLDHDQSTDRANANLIAAAPDLLAACEKLLAAYDDARASGHGSILIEEARTAIAKAKGGAA